MKDIRVNGRFMRVFVLTESDERIIYIPIKSLHRTDYDRLLDIEKRCGGNRSMLEEMKKTKLENGKNALTLYDNIIQVADIRATKNNIIFGDLLLKPDDPNYKPKSEQEVEELAKEVDQEKPKRGPGRPPGGS